MRGRKVSNSLKGPLSSLHVCLPRSLQQQPGVGVWGREEDHTPGKWNGTCEGPTLVSYGYCKKLPQTGDSKQQKYILSLI